MSSWATINPIEIPIVMLQLKYREEECYSSLLKFLPCKHPCISFAVSNGVNKSELGHDSQFYGLWHIICVCVSRAVNESELGCDICTSQMAAHPAGAECHSPGESRGFIACLWWRNNLGWKIRNNLGWKILPCREECEPRAAPWDPSCAPKSCSCESLTPPSQNFTESWVPEGCTNNRPCQTAVFDIACSKFENEVLFSFPLSVLGSNFLSGAAWDEKRGSCFTWAFLGKETLNDCVDSSLILFHYGLFLSDMV